MSHIKSIALNKIMTIPNWKYAPLGTLLQVTDTNGVVAVGMRCEQTIQDNTSPCILIIDQIVSKKNGHIFDENTIHYPALDMSGILEIHVDKPSVINFTDAVHNTVGLVCESGAGSGQLFIKAINGTLRGYVLLSDPTNTTPVGTFTSQVPPDLFVVGSAMVVAIV